MGLQWVSVEARTGNIIADLPLLSCPKVLQTIGRYEVTTATLPVDVAHAAPDWVRATRKGAACLILLEDNPLDPSHGIPIWGGMVTRRRRSESDTIKLDLITIDGYLDRRFVGDKTYAAVGQNDIMTDLVNTYIKDGARPGIPIRVQVVGGGAGTLRDRTYYDQDDKTIYSIFSDLSGVIGGPEWYCGWEWQTAPERLTPVIYVGDRIGNDVPAGLAPAAVFDMPGCVRSFEMLEDYGVGRGATDVMAVSSGQGAVRPQSPRQVSDDPALPTFEYRWTPSTSITEIATLTEHAQEKLGVMDNGSTSITLTSDVATAPMLGIDWFIGDEVGYSLGGLDDQDRELVPAFPGGQSGSARVAGWERTLDNNPTITPTLVNVPEIV